MDSPDAGTDNAQPSLAVTLADIEQARERVDDALHTTPFAKSEPFSKVCGASVFFKFENLHMTGSFKERGALNKLLTLTPEERAKGVIAASAGNHAQGVAFHAGRLGIRATIVMPEATPLIKVSSTRSFGAQVVLAGLNYDEAYAEARRIQQEQGLTFVHPFDDREVIAGQGTMALEILEQNPYLDYVVVPIGGGGLASGVAVAIKEVNPKIKVIGVQASAIASMKASVASGHLETLEAASTLADGIAVKRPGSLTFPLIQRYVDDIVTVDDEEIANAILLLLEREKTVVEGAGAVPLAALLNRKIPKAAGRKVGMILSGGNIDVNTLARIIERGLVKDGRLVRLMVRLPDKPGALARFTAAVAEQKANVLEIYHNRAFSRSPLGETEVELTAETRGPDHIAQLKSFLEGKGYTVREET